MRCANKKASLSISTNAIVILIVAVIMLGLIIGLVTRGFSAVERQFLGQIEENEPKPDTPTTSNPITLSTQSKIASRGERAGFKVNILNTRDGTLESVSPTISCQGGLAVTNEQAIAKDIDVGQVERFTYLFAIPDDAQSDVYLCQMKAVEGSSSDSAVRAAEFQLTIE